MRQSTDRILTTHAGSLPRPDELLESLYARSEGASIEAAAKDKIRSAVADVVRQQADTGIDVIDDGEVGKAGFIETFAQSLLCENVRPDGHACEACASCGCASTGAGALCSPPWLLSELSELSELSGLSGLPEPPLEEEPPWSSPVVVPDEESSDLRSSFFFSDFFESSSRAVGSAFPCVATGTEAGVAANVLAELR